MLKVTGGCKYCGQVATFEVPDAWEDRLTEEFLTEEATKRCNCVEALTASEKDNARIRAEKYVDRCLEDKVIADFAKDAIPHVIQGKIEAITINVGLGEKLVLKTSSKRYITAKHSITRQTAMEE